MLMAIKRAIVVLIGVILQFGLAIVIRLYFNEQFAIISIIYWLMSVLIILFILKNSTRLSSDLPWIIIILIFPILGTILLITLGGNYMRSRLLRRILIKEKEYAKYYEHDDSVKREIDDNDLDQLRYIEEYAKFPISKNNKITYYKLGDEFFPELLKELEKAEKFIFIEYFIINKGKMWNRILDILKDKAQNGVDVRVMYDDIGSIAMLSSDYYKELEVYGIKCISFNKISPFKGIFMNNRDHRKMTIIDGKVAFTGGVNLSDEYINVVQVHGHWKDNAIKIVGPAIWNLTVTFLSMWNANLDEDSDILKFKYDFKNTKIKENGYVVPYATSPFHESLVGEEIYLNIINGARKYLYIYTPYLIIDTDIINSLTRAVKRGVDVRIIVPGIPDKKIIYTVTNSYFKILVDQGVKIYTYTPGFVHSKVFVSDDIRAVVGTLNLDYRSLYLHFENGIYMENVSEIASIKADLMESIEKSHLLTRKEVNPKFIKSLWQAILRLIAPLL